ncbi:hypothetical protein JR316_0004311 [Psilocybe cubensis]|uniref:Uncharacterized protein n=1 Tax=Psilocybe cubensis TaxID=181762 RepID=A0ACB8H3Z6_PSICU|nr:hypothetical protein JR316_0004311 [Psilocybe cubensis]KAH9482216.1 hypothetical protein JR316_0004311 [Psilocybe cubensis]
MQAPTQKTKVNENRISFCRPLLSLAEIIEFAEQLMTTRYVAVAGVIILIYDWMITFDEEVSSIWPAKISSTKVIFLLNRYVNIGSQLSMIVYLIGLVQAKSQTTCVFYIIAYGGTVFLALASVHVLVILRAWVVWNRQPSIALALASAYTIYAVACIALISYAAITHANLTFAFEQFSTTCHVSNMILWAVFWRTPYNMIAVTFNCCLMNVAGQRFVLDLRRAHEERMMPSRLALSDIDTRLIIFELLTRNDRELH